MRPSLPPDGAAAKDPFERPRDFLGQPRRLGAGQAGQLIVPAHAVPVTAATPPVRSPRPPGYPRQPSGRGHSPGTATALGTADRSGTATGSGVAT